MQQGAHASLSPGLCAVPNMMQTAQEYLPALKAIPKAEIRRVVCGMCGDFKVVITQPCAPDSKDPIGPVAQPDARAIGPRSAQPRTAPSSSENAERLPMIMPWPTYLPYLEGGSP